MRLYEPVITKTTHFRFPDCFVVELAVLNAALQAHPCNSDYRPRPASANPWTIKILKLGRALMAIDAGEEIVAPWNLLPNRRRRAAIDRRAPPALCDDEPELYPRQDHVRQGDAASDRAPT